jgi:Type II secretion system (T2SS), protein K
MHAPRRGIILLAVMIVITVLSLAAYQYADYTSSELKASYNAIRLAQARAAAKSGVHHIAAMLASPDNVSLLLGGNLYDNERFRGVPVPGIDGATFTLLAPPEPGSGGGNRHGLIDESGKLNLNAFLWLDFTGGDLLAEGLLTIPGMTQDVANSIVDYMDIDDEIRQQSAESEYYQTMTPPYRAKNTFLDSLEELLLVKGVTPDLLYGADTNRNGILDADEDPNGDLGWQQYLTVYSREQLLNDQGQVLQNINAALNTQIASGLYQGALLYDMITITVSEDMAKYLALYATQKTKGSFTSTSKPSGQTGNLADVSRDSLTLTKGTKSIKSLFALVNTYVTVPAANKGDKDTIYYCPLADPNLQRDLLPKLFSNFTTQTPQTYMPQSATNQDIPARINVNTAPLSVLQILPKFLGDGTPLADADLQNILALRPQLTGGAVPDPIFQTPAWLLTEAKLDPAILQKLENYVTTRSQIYRVHVVGTVGPISARVEAIIDVNGGRPRVTYYRDLSESGPATMPQQ